MNYFLTDFAKSAQIGVSFGDAQNNWDAMTPFSRVQILYRIDSLGLLDDEANEKYDLKLDEKWVEADSQERKLLLKDFANALTNSNAIIKRL